MAAIAEKERITAARKLIKKGTVGQAPRTSVRAPQTPYPTTLPPKTTTRLSSSASKSSPEATAAKQNFKVNDQIVYPAHGVGKIVAVERQLIAGTAIELFVIVFEQEKMRLRVPTEKAKIVGMRALSDPKLIKDAIITLKGRARIKRTMWSRRAQEYDAKINSGDIICVAEVVRDLYRSTEQPEQSYSERQLFEAAIDRMAREVAAVKKLDLADAIAELDATLQLKQPV